MPSPNILPGVSIPQWDCDRSDWAGPMVGLAFVRVKRLRWSHGDTPRGIARRFWIPVRVGVWSPVMREVDLAVFAAAHTTGAVVIDVREPGEYVSGHVPGARLLPLGRLPEHLGEMTPGQRVYVICAS